MIIMVKKYSIGNGYRQGMNRDENSLVEKRPYLPSQEKLVNYLRKYIKGHESELDNIFGKTKWKHWIRLDKSGFAYPSKEDWIILKNLLKLDDSMDKAMTYIIVETQAVLPQNRKIVYEGIWKPKEELFVNVCPKCGGKIIKLKRGWYCTKVGCNWHGNR